MTLLFDNIFSSVAVGHLMVDLINGQRSVLLAYLSNRLELTNATLGLISTVYVFSASLIQPIFGYISDRLSAKWVITGGLLWMGVFYALALLIPGEVSLFLLVLASMGSGAYHPAATMQATLRGRSVFNGREVSASAYFFVFGQLGYFFGPIFAGPALDFFGIKGLLVFAFIAVLVGIGLILRLRSVEIDCTGLSNIRSTKVSSSQRLSMENQGSVPGLKTYHFVVILLPLIIVAALQSWIQQNMVTFIPKYLNDLGQTASHYGLVAASFMGGSIIGNILGGYLADRFGKRIVVTLSLFLAIMPLYVMPLVNLSYWLYLSIALAGVLTGSVYSILVVLAQRIIPGGMGMASGLILGFMFSAGALGTFISGYIADIWGLPLVFKLNSVIACIASLMAIKFKE